MDGFCFVIFTQSISKPNIGKSDEATVEKFLCGIPQIPL
jgi:hypothetical protein